MTELGDAKSFLYGGTRIFEELDTKARALNFPTAHWGDLNNEVHTLFQDLKD